MKKIKKYCNAFSVGAYKRQKEVQNNRNKENEVLDMEPRIDFSRFSKVRDSLKEELMSRYDMSKGKKSLLSEDELDEVAAAGGMMRRRRLLQDDGKFNTRL